jgi:hypothetical protein
MDSKPWYKSVKKWLGISFAISVLVGGIYIMATNTERQIDVLELWGVMSLTFMGITSGIKLGYKVVDKMKKKEPE